MNTHKLTWGTEPIGDSINHRARRTISVLVAALRVTLYAVLAVLRPFVVAGLSALTLLGLAMTIFYALLLPGSHFPIAIVLIMSVASALMIVVFYAFMELLLPR
jgi:hypothetical protein